MGSFTKLICIILFGVGIVGGIYLLTSKMSAPTTPVRKEIPLDLGQPQEN